MATLKILITGATGYIGGTFLTSIVGSSHASLKSASYSILLRSTSQATLFQNFNVTPVILQSPDDTDELRRIGSEFDIIVNFAYTFLPQHAKALVEGLGDRERAKLGFRVPIFIQASSGTSNLADRPFSMPDRVAKLSLPPEYTDLRSGAVYNIEKLLEAEEPYPQRTAELSVIDIGLAVGVKTHIVMSPTIYGNGTGPGNKTSIQIPLWIKSVLNNGYLAIAGDGDGEWDRVHIFDLISLLTILLTRVIDGQPVPSGKDGIIFSGTSRNTWKDLAHAIIKVGVKLGKISNTTETKHLPLKEAVERWGLEKIPGESIAELGFASNSRTNAEIGREWGWQPKFVDVDEGIEEDWLAITANSAV